MTGPGTRPVPFPSPSPDPHAMTSRLNLLTASLLAAGFALAGPAFAAEHTVKMLNTGPEGPMVFEPAFIKAAVGDTVVFTPTEKGAHNSASLLLPAGAKPWKGTPDAEVRVKLEKEGVYLYACEPHKIMGMVGVLQVGKPVNLAEAKALATKEQATFAMGKDRFDKALKQVK